MPKTQLVLRDNVVYARPASKGDHELIRNLPVRYWRDGQWMVPFESANDLVSLLDDRAEVHPGLKERLNLLNNLTKNKFDKYAPIPEELEELKTKFYDHQIRWLIWAKNFSKVANTSEQGTGKSKMAMDWVTIKGLRLVLFIVKNNNVYKWASEVKKHSDYIPVVLKGTRQERQAALQKAGHLANNSRAECTGVACIINYEYVHTFLVPLSSCKWSGIVCDESTAIKSSRTKRHKAVVKLGERVRYRLILTGTPILNTPEDAYGQFRFLNPGIFGKNAQGFKNRYITYGGWSGYQVTGYRNLDELSSKIDSYSYRVLKKDCLDLPPKTFDPVGIEAAGEFAKGYDALVKATLLEIGDRVVDNTLAITKLARCLQYCSGFIYTNSKTVSFVEHNTPKMVELLDFMEDHYKSNRKLIIWAYHKATLILLHRKIQARFPDLDVRVANSQLSVNDRSNVVNWMNDPSYDASGMDTARCLILQSTSFMHGIDIRCDTAYYYQRLFSLEEWLQTQDRIHGINRGGTKCNYIVSTILGTVEETVDKALASKKALSDLIVDKVGLEGLMRGEYG